MIDTESRYRYWRRHGLPASAALSYVRTEQQYAAIDIDWDAHDGEMRGTIEHERGRILVFIAEDDMPYDWGDIEPTEEEAAKVEAFCVRVEAFAGDDPDPYTDSICGVDAINLPGYITRDWEDAARYALAEYLLDGAKRYLDVEQTEREHWAARDTVTV